MKMFKSFQKQNSQFFCFWACLLSMVKTKALSEEELIKLLDKVMEEDVVGAKKAAHGAELVVEYRED